MEEAFDTVERLAPLETNELFGAKYATNLLISLLDYRV